MTASFVSGSPGGDKRYLPVIAPWALSFRLREEDRGTDFTVAFVFSLKPIPSSSRGDDRLNSTRLFGN